MEKNKMEINLKTKKQIQFNQRRTKFVLLGLTIVVVLCSVFIIFFNGSTNPLSGSWYLYSRITDEKEEIVENNNSLGIDTFGRINIECQNDDLSWEIITREDGKTKTFLSMKMKDNLEFYSEGMIIELKKIDNSFEGKYDIEGEWKAFSFKDTREDAYKNNEEIEETEFFLSNKVEENKIICSVILNKQKTDLIFELKDENLEFTLRDEKKIYKKVDENQDFVLKNTYMSLEYGEQLPTDIQDYIDTDLTKKSLISKIEMDTSKIKFVKDKNYPQIGNYEIAFTYKNKKEILYLDVKDTTEPSFVNLKEELEFVKNNKPSKKELSNKFSVKDLNKCTITVDDSEVDYSKLGIYEALVTAEDESGNTATENITIKIVNEIGQELKKIENEDEAMDIVLNSNHYKKEIEPYTDPQFYYFNDYIKKDDTYGYSIQVRVQAPDPLVTNYVTAYFVSEYGQIFWYDRLNDDELVEVN